MINYGKASFKKLFVLVHLFSIINLKAADDLPRITPGFSWKKCLLLNLAGCIGGRTYLSSDFLADVRGQNHAAAKEVSEKSQKLALKTYDKAIENPRLAGATVGVASLGLLVASGRSQSRPSAVAGVMTGSTTYLHLKRKELERQDAKIAAAKQQETDRLVALNIDISDLELKRDEVLAEGLYNYDLAKKAATGAEELRDASAAQADKLKILKNAHDELGAVISSTATKAKRLNQSADKLGSAVNELKKLVGESEKSSGTGGTGV